MSTKKNTVRKLLKESIFDSIEPKHTNIVTTKLRRFEEACISVHSKYPLLFLLFGSCFVLIPLLGLQDFDVSRYETDLARLMSPLESKTLKNKDEIQGLFGKNITFSNFYPHQFVIGGFDITVLRLLPYFNETAIENERAFYEFLLENVTVGGDNDSNVDLKDLCALHDGECVVQGSEIFQEHNITFPIFQGSDLSEIIGGVAVFNDNTTSMKSTKVFKLKFFLRYDTPYYEEKSSQWIQKVSDIETKKNFTFYSSSNPLACSNVEFDLTDLDVTIILPISFFLCFVISLFNRGVLSSLLALSFVCLITLGIISYIQIGLLKIMALVLVFLQAELLTFMVGLYGDWDHRLENNYSIVKSAGLNALFFGIGISSQFLIVQIFCITACISMVALIVVATTATSLSRIVELAIKGGYFTTCATTFSCLMATFSCLFCVVGDNWFEKQKYDETNNESNETQTEDMQGTQHRRSQSPDDACTLEDNQGRVGEITTASTDTSSCCLKLKSFERQMKFAITLLIYLGYMGAAIYGICRPNTWPDLYSYDVSESQSFCYQHATAFDRDFIVTLVVKPKITTDWNLTNAALTSFIDISVNENIFDPEYQINWLSDFMNNTIYDGAIKPEALSSFLIQNKLYQNDIVAVENGGILQILAFRIYLKTRDIIKDQDIVKMMRNLQSLENEAPFDCFFYAPQFLLYAGSVSWVDDFLRTSAIAIGTAVLILTVCFYHYRGHALLIILMMISTAVGVIGFTKFWIFGLSFVSTIPMLLMISSFVKFFVNEIDPFAILFPGFFGVAVFVSIFLLPEFMLRSVGIPFFLYLIFLFLHRFLFSPQLALNWLKGSKYKQFTNPTSEELQTTAANFDI